MDSELENWLSEFSTNTANTYKSALKKFKRNLGIEDMGEYLQGDPDVLEDFKKFANSLADRPPKTISTYTGAVKVFFADHDLEISSKDLRKLRRRNVLPRKARAITPDKIPSKNQLRTILNYLDIKGRSVILFLVSSGCRIGEALQIMVEDFDAESDPPSVKIRGNTTKGGDAGRVVYMSYEARDAILDWLRVRGSLKKRSGTGLYESDLVFPFTPSNARKMWNRACKKAGLEVKDIVTGRRLYHLHCMRKFFRTNIGLSDDYVHSLMGHLGYLDASYFRPDQNDIAEAYKANMDRVSIYGLEDQELMRSILDAEKQLKDEIKVIKDNLFKFTEMDWDDTRRMMDWWNQYKLYLQDLDEEESQKLDWRKLKRGELKIKPIRQQQKIVPENELERWLSSGWVYLSSLNNGSNMCVVRQSTH